MGRCIECGKMHGIPLFTDTKRAEQGGLNSSKKQSLKKGEDRPEQDKYETRRRNKSVTHHQEEINIPDVIIFCKHL